MDALAARAETILHLFHAKKDGAFPAAGLLQDSAGNFFGTTGDGIHTVGTVYELSPDGAGGYSFKIIYTLQNKLDGAIPQSQLVFDAKGNLYGTSVTGGSYSQGAVFELSQDRHGHWFLSNSYDFVGTFDGGHPAAGVVVDAAGHVYGTTESSLGSNAGTVFELTPSKKLGFIETTVHAFQDASDGGFPHGSLVLDKSGDVYGTASSGDNTAPVGVVFRMHNDGKRWHEDVLYTFTGGADGGIPESNLIFDASGNLYGTTTLSGGGVFELSPPGSGGKHWAVKPLYQFTDGPDGGYPYSGLVFDGAGNLYGATLGGGHQGCPNTGCGVVYKLSPTQTGPWTEHVLKKFNAQRTGYACAATLVLGAKGALFGTAQMSGRGAGVVFSLAAPR